MKILVASFTYAPNVDGVAEATRLMVKNFRNAGHEVRVVTGKASISNSDMPETEEGVWRFSISGSPVICVGFHGEIDAYHDFLLSYSPDVIVFHCWDTWPLEVAVPLMPVLPSKLILFSHGYASHLLDIGKLPRGLWKWLRWLPQHLIYLPRRLRQFDKVVFLSTKTDLNRFFDAWVANKIHCRNTMVIPNGIDTAGWQTIPANFREREQLGGGAFFLCVANYLLVKNQEMALNAYLLANIPGSVLVFVGTTLGEYGERVQASWNRVKANYTKLDVRFLQGLNREQVISALRSCDIAVLASKTEAQPLSLLEAMACGKPFISTDVGCVSELAGGVIVRDTETMAAQMHLLATNPAQRTLLGQNAKLCFNSLYSSEVTNPAWLNLLEEVVTECHSVDPVNGRAAANP